MTSVLLIYPFFIPRRDRSVFRFPPLGIGYIAATLQAAGHAVRVIDCTFMKREDALREAREAQAEVVGIYCMVTMLDECTWFAQQLRGHCRLLVTGGPLPTCDPEPFLEHFDVVVRGEAEQTMLELLRAWEDGSGLDEVAGIVHKKEGRIVFTPERTFARDLDRIPFPARQLLPNASYIRYGRKKYGYSITTVMSTRGCPYRCEFCSNVVFGGSYRERSAENVVDEIEAVLTLGYDRISFTDDVFTMKKERVLKVCEEIQRRGLSFKWECLGRVDAMDASTAQVMQEAGCMRIYFGIESGDPDMLELMNKKITPDQAQRAVETAHRAGMQVGAFFILCYPGDTDDSVLETLHFTTLLPVDYLGLSMPYPLPGTDLLRRTRDRNLRTWHPEESRLGSHVLIFDADFSEGKMWFAILKGQAQLRIRKHLGRFAPPVLRLFEKTTDGIFRRLK
jgi:anaerobic magnesium-protoporphyrin IX monomethyl ester cyclase